MVEQILPQENSASNKLPFADAHCDFLYGMTYYDYDIQTVSGHQSMSLRNMAAGGVKLQFFAAWIDMLLKQNPLSQCLNMIDSYYRMLESNPCFVPFSRDFDVTQDKIATVLTVEGGEAVEGSVENLRMLYRLGVRAMTLTWNDVNSLAYPAGKRGSKKGLTALGKRVVEEMCRIGMAVDLAHLGDAGIDDVLGIAARPVFASHTNARALCSHPRCMKDEHIRAISKQGGVIGVNFYYRQLTDERTAYAENGVGDLRLTIDENLRYRTHNLDLLSGTYGDPILPAGKCIMELKTPHTLPLWLAALLDEHRIFPTSFSKYATAYNIELNRILSQKRGAAYCG